MRILSQQGDTVDLICWRELGSEAATAETLTRNPGLADAGPILAPGTPVELPETSPAATPTRELVQLWD